jgi:acetyl esterase
MVVAAAAAGLAAVVAPAAAAPARPSVAIGVQRDVLYGVANGKPLLLDAYVPPDRRDGSLRPAVVMIHGGGFRAGDKASWEPEARRVADKGWVAFSIAYRLDEPTAFPAAVEDAQAAVRWARANAAAYGVDPARIGAVGESAGGTLAAMLATLGEGSLEEGSRVRAAVAWSAPLDLTRLARERGDGWAAPLLGCALSECPETYAAASPITHVDRTDAPTFLITSEEDPVVPATQSYDMAIRLEEEGVRVRLTRLRGERHGLELRDEMWGATLNFLDTHLELDPRRAYGTAAFVGTVLVTAALAGLVFVRHSRRGAAGGPHRSGHRPRRQGAETVTGTRG